MSETDGGLASENISLLKRKLKPIACWLVTESCPGTRECRLRPHTLLFWDPF